MPLEEVYLSSDILFDLSMLGSNIRAARHRRNIKQSELETMTGISRKTLSNIEKGVSSVSLKNYLIVLDTLGLKFKVSDLASPMNDPLSRSAGVASDNAGSRVRKVAGDVDRDF